VLCYVPLEQRRRFADIVRGVGAVWLSNEGPDVLPDLPVPRDGDGESFVLVRDGRTPVARTDPHGTWLRWLGTGA
jgi:hypothetical protein